jgi:hypothetical protein
MDTALPSVKKQELSSVLNRAIALSGNVSVVLDKGLG